jgi:DNA-directed RNA polymerase subunit RPC12/RpoP
MVYKCETCYKEFISKTDFTRHIARKFKCVSERNSNKTDIGYVCFQCSKIFTRKYNLNVHIKQYCKEKELYLLRKRINEVKIILQNLEMI